LTRLLSPDPLLVEPATRELVMRTPLILLSIALGSLAGCASDAPIQADDQAVLALDIKDAVLVEPQLVSSGQYTEAQFAKLPSLGYRTVIQLRLPTEEGAGWEEAQAKQLGLKFVRIPVVGAKDLTEVNARLLDTALRERSGGTIVECNSGNRVGGLFALRAFYCDKMPADKAIERGRKAGLTKAEPDVRRVLGLPDGK